MTIGGRAEGLEQALLKMTEDYKKLGVKHANLLKKEESHDADVEALILVASKLGMTITKRPDFNDGYAMTNTRAQRAEAEIERLNKIIHDADTTPHSEWAPTLAASRENVEGTAALLKEAEAQIELLKSAIKNHRSQKADDRCIEDDDALYAVLGDGILCDRRVGSKEEMLKNCSRFIERRCEGGHWPTYSSLEAEVKNLKDQLAHRSSK
jgi:hypothetical protein